MTTDESERWLSLSFFAHHLAVTLCFSVCAPSCLVPGAFLGPTGRGVRWFLGSFLLGKPFFSWNCIPSFVVFGFVWTLFRHMPASLCPWRGFVLSTGFLIQQKVFWHSLVSGVWCENGAYKLLALFFIVGAGAFSVFFFFGLLVALNIMSGDLKLCRECVV